MSFELLVKVLRENKILFSSVASFLHDLQPTSQEEEWHIESQNSRYKIEDLFLPLSLMCLSDDPAEISLYFETLEKIYRVNNENWDLAIKLKSIDFILLTIGAYKEYFLLAHKKYPLHYFNHLFIRTNFGNLNYELLKSLFFTSICSEEEHQSAREVLSQFLSIGLFSYLNESIETYLGWGVFPEFSGKTEYFESFVPFSATIRFLSMAEVDIDEVFKRFLEKSLDDYKTCQTFIRIFKTVISPYLINFYSSTEYLSFIINYQTTDSTKGFIEELALTAGIDPETKHLFIGLPVLSLKEFCRISIRRRLIENSKSNVEFFDKINSLECEVSTGLVKYLKYMR